MRLRAAFLVVVSLALCGCAARSGATLTPRAPAQEVVHEVALDVEEPVAPLARPLPTIAAEPVDGVVHIVQPGQTLWRIAHAYGVDLDRLAAANGIDDPTRVTAGTPVFIPGATATIDVAAYPATVPSARTALVFHPEPSADFLWPVHGGEFMRPFGEPRRHHTHAGVDIRGALGQDILAARDGVVAFEGNTKTGYGNVVVLDHGDGVQTLYAHAQKVLVKQGDAVRRGQAIALLGRSGNATTEHCHFEIRLENRAVNPMPYLTGTTEAHR